MRGASPPIPLARDVVRAGRDHLLAALRPVLTGTRALALLDFPMHANVGDSAIWLGALAALRDVGAPAPTYTADYATYDRAALRRAIGDGTICFTGGGSFGDLWEQHLLFRERVVADFPDNRIVQLPESVHFQRPASLARACAVFNAHRDVTIFVRDVASLTLMQREFRAASYLTCDLAFGLGMLTRPAAATQTMLWLKRADHEDRYPAAAGVPSVDWMDEPRTRGIVWSDALREAAARDSWLRPLRAATLRRCYPHLARARLARGLALLSTAKVVITDRLHGHILSLQLGIPHVVLDNSYGKLHQFVQAWTHSSPIVRLAHSMDDAADIAQTLLPLADA